MKRRKKRKPTVAPGEQVLADLGLSPDRWRIHVQFGKTMGGQYTFIGITITDLVSGKEHKSGERCDCDSKNEARKVAANLAKRSMKRVLAK